MNDARPNLGDLMKTLIDSGMGGRMTANQRAGLAWNMVNGDVERAHTTGVFVIPPSREGTLPTLGVYVDSRARSVDFMACREVYLARLDMAGHHFSDIRFLVTKAKYLRKRSHVQEGTEVSKPPLPQLAPAEERQIAQLASRLDGSLHDKVLEAMRLSFRREKSQSSQNRR